jgi:hypothetical protein
MRDPQVILKRSLDFFGNYLGLFGKSKKERKKEKLNIARKLVGCVCQTNP